VDSADLVAYAEGDAPERIVEHVRRCPSCAAEAERYAHADRRLRGTFYRLGCPSPQTIGEYHLNLLSPTERQDVAAHLLECPRCADELRTLREFFRGDLVDEAALSPSLASRVRRIVATLVPASPGPARVALRGAADQSMRTYRAGDLTITVAWRPGSQPGRATLVGLLLPDGDGSVEDREARLIAGTAPGAERREGTARVERTDELGNFLFDDVRPGTYRLEIDLPAATVVVEDLVWSS
jgi:anti-sigma factor RsiW